MTEDIPKEENSNINKKTEENKEEINEPKKPIKNKRNLFNKSVIKMLSIMSFIGIMMLLIGYVIGSSQNSEINPDIASSKIVIGAKPELVMIQPNDCGNLCTELEPVINDDAKNYNLGFRKVLYRSNVTNIPGLFYLSSTEMTPIVGMSNKQIVGEYMCRITGDSNLCSNVNSK